MAMSRMEMAAWVVVGAGWMVTPIAAGEPTLSAAVKEMYTTIARDFVDAARVMPGDGYAYRPTADVRSFGQIVGHVAGSQFLYCLQAGGPRFDRARLERLEPVRKYADPDAPVPGPAPAKEVLVALLDEGVAYCGAVHAAMTDAAAVTPVTIGARETIRLRPLLDNIAHTNEHYGNVVTYLRERGLVPPSTARGRGASAARRP